MSDFGAEVKTIMSDARRAASPGAIGHAPDRAGVLVAQPTGTAETYIPSASPLSVAIEGPGLFVLQEAGARAYTRLGKFHVDDYGRLLDDNGRSVLGFSADQGDEGDLRPLAVTFGDVTSRRFENYRIDENGAWSGEVNKNDPKSRARSREFIPLGRLALAIFPAPERLALAADETLHYTRAAGAPLFIRPGTLNGGTLRPHALAAPSIDLQGDLARLWMLRRRGELAAAMAGANDQCVKTALGLVK